MATDENPDTVSSEQMLNQINEIIQAASKHDLKTLEKCLDSHSFPDCKAVDVQDPATSYSPLHAAISSTNLSPNDNGSKAAQQEINEETACDILRFLLENGAIWNQLDKNDETPGCIAHRLGLMDAYQVMVDAGVRAEMLLSRLDQYEQLEDVEELLEGEDGPAGEASEASEAPDTAMEDPEVQGDVTSKAYLSSTLSYQQGKLLDDQQNGVMMAWESEIMLQSANNLLSEPGMKILNIGFGMGIIDSHIQAHPNKPAEHHIVEAHPDVLTQMREKGWFDKPNVVVHSGKWQDVLPRLVGEGETFNAIYFDTFAESYADFREFCTEHVIGLLDQHGTWSFFNGMGADRQISYDVYQKVVELDLFESGFDVEWTNVDLPKLDQEWEGVRRPYWNVDHYRLPVCKFMD